MKFRKLFVALLTFSVLVLFASSIFAQTTETYEVKKGDCLSKVSKKEYKEYKLWPAIWEANKNGVVNKDKMDKEKYKTIPNPNLIFIGQVLKIPKDPKVSADLEKDAMKAAKKFWKKMHHKKAPTEEGKKDEKKDVKKDEKKDVKKDTKKDEKKDVKKDEKKK